MSRIFLGRIVKAFGIRGELKFHPSDDFWDDVLQSKNLIWVRRIEGKLSDHALAIEKARPHGANFVFRVEGVDDRNAAENVVGSEVYIDEEQIDVDMPDGLLPYQLVGMNVKSDTGEALGKVSSVIYSSAHDVYEVTGKRGSFLVPAVPEFIVSIDGSTETIVVRPMPGLIDE